MTATKPANVASQSTWPAVRISTSEGQFAVALFYAPEQETGTVVGAGNHATFAEAFGDALIVGNLLGAQIVIGSDAAALLARGSAAIGAMIAATTMVEGGEQ